MQESINLLTALVRNNGNIFLQEIISLLLRRSLVRWHYWKNSPLTCLPDRPALWVSLGWSEEA